MILNALDAYYTRLADDPRADIPKPGFSRQKIHFALVLDRAGTLVQVYDLRKTDKTRGPQELVVPEGENRSANIAPNYLWDNTGYVLGIDKTGVHKRSLEMFEAFRQRHHLLGDSIDDEGMKALLIFLDAWKPEETEEKYGELLRDSGDIWGLNVVFKLDGDMEYLHEREKIKEAWETSLLSLHSDYVATCALSNQKAPIARLHPKIKGVRGAQTAGASIVSFNLDAFTSYGKKQSYNAPVSERAAFTYTTALNYLLRFDSRQKLQIGDAAVLFWTERKSPVEWIIPGMLGSSENMELDTEEGAHIKAVRNFLEAAKNGEALPEIKDGEMKYYILGLSPNASRLAVRFWHVSSVKEIISSLGAHFHDLAIERSYESDPEFPAPWQLLRETAALKKSENISPVLSGALMRAILTGADYPQSLLSAVITRIRADQTVNYLRAATIKGVLNRKFRKSGNKKMEVTMGLDKGNKAKGYRLGRLFAVLERIQERASPGLNATIRDRCYGAASATPVTMFPHLLQLKNHHIAKMENKGEGVNLEKLIGEIVSEINEFPRHLKLEEQGLFAIGYYHQRADFFNKNESREEKNE